MSELEGRKGVSAYDDEGVSRKIKPVWRVLVQEESLGPNES